VSSFFTELKRRSVFRVGIAYLVTTWLLIQIADTVFPRIGLPDSAVTLVIALLAIGFIPALILAWAYEMTPEGVRREAEVDRSGAASQPGRKLDFAIIALLIIALGYFVWESRFSPPQIEDNVIPAEKESDPISASGVQTSEKDEEKLDPTPFQKSIAILPFENISRDTANDPFTIGIHDDLLTQVSKIGSLDTISRTSVLRYAGTEKPIPEIANELGVANVLEGGVQLFSLSMHGPMSTCGPKPTIVNSVPRIYSPSRARSPPQWLMRSRRH
jgi:hypothetical protein